MGLKRLDGQEDSGGANAGNARPLASRNFIMQHVPTGIFMPLQYHCASALRWFVRRRIRNTGVWVAER
jgi:hypothetical protein